MPQRKIFKPFSLITVSLSSRVKRQPAALLVLILVIERKRGGKVESGEDL